MTESIITLSAPAAHHEAIRQDLLQLKRGLVGVYGLMLAGVDGRPVEYVLHDEDANPTAAISAATLQLGRRLAEVLGDGRLDEITVRTGNGWVIVYPVGDRWALTVLATASTTVARIHLECRELCPRLAGHLENLAAVR